MVYTEVVAVPESVYKVIELVGTSSESWEKAAAAAVEKAASSLRDLRIAEVSELDLQIENGVVKAYRGERFQTWTPASSIRGSLDRRT